MNAGQLRQRVTLQQSTLATADTYGQQAEAWVDLATVWARVRSLGGTETWKQNAVQPEASHEVTVRYRSDVTQARRFRWGTRYLYPLSVVTDERKTQCVCLCKERLSSG